MEWRPKTWIAVVLAILVQPLAMLYLMRVGWAVVYFLVIVTIGLTEFYLTANNHIPWLRYFSFNYIVMVICAVHAYRLSRNSTVIRGRPWYSRWYGLLSILLVPYIAIFITRVFFFEPFSIPSGSMLPTLPIGSHIVVDKWGYGNYRLFGIPILKTHMTAKINRGDMLVFDYPENPGIQFVMRVVGLPGDRVEYNDRKLVINGEKAKYTEIEKKGDAEILRESIDGHQNLIRISTRYELKGGGTYIIPAHDYFVLGDSRDNAKDSRYWGYLPQSNIIGKVILTLK